MSTSHKSNSTQARDHKAFSDHIGELRMRVMWVALTFIVTSAIAYQYRDILVSVVLSPLGHQKLVYLTPAGGFAFIFQVTMYAGAVVTAPLLIYQLYKFVQPALPLRATRYSIRIVLSSIALMVAGVCFGYFVAVPSALHFLTTFAGTYVEASLTADSYLNFIVAYVVGLGLLFQLPLLLVFWNWMSPMSPKKLFSSQKFIVLFAFIAAAMITPTPDPANQALIAVPIVLIYQIGVIAVTVINRRQRKKTPTHKPVPMAVPSATQPRTAMPSVPQIQQAPRTMVAKPVAAQPAAPMVVKVARPRPVMAGGIDGIRRARQQTAPPPIPARAEVKLITPARPTVLQRGRPGVSMDGISRVFSA